MRSPGWAGGDPDSLGGVTAPHLGTPRAVPGGAATVARLSTAALEHNARPALERGRGEVSALYADAWGHGADWVAGVLERLDLDPEALDAETLFGLPAPDARTRPVLTLTGRVLSTKDLRAGEGVSYGYAHRADADTRVALVTGGYAQGIVRMLGNRVAVRIGAALHPLVGRVAMDVCVVDITEHPVSRGDEVVFFGDPRDQAPSLAGWADATGWTAGELITAAGLRAVREVRA
ncbi:alanine racemase [Microbacterium sp. EYE_512]|uniref:Alanine racemase n=1 Tax=Microbacterium wangchenii TaxID=2541726 RepID=A0ABX5SVG0_9MICO|nr:alanine racemase [Microbacterium sp. EYE_512]QBR88820.1 alanine racemase [Microbacterium wangchenii]TXK20545.1 alanine racemase [Microbacterium wangchenii]